MYVAQRQTVQSLIRSAKVTYYKGLVEGFSGDSKKLYRLANNLLNRKATSVLPNYNVAEELACKFSIFFKNKVSTICDDLSSFTLRAPSPPSPAPAPAPTLDSPLDQFRHVTSDEIETIIMKSPAKTCDLDAIPTDLLKKCIPVVLPAITAIINSSFSSGIVPSCLKMADVHPVLKKPGLDRNCLQNYRPISNLPFYLKGYGTCCIFPAHKSS